MYYSSIYRYGTRVEGLSTFIIVMVFALLAVLVGLVLFFMIRRSRKMQSPPTTVHGKVIEKKAGAMGEEEVLLELDNGTRKRCRLVHGKPMICPGDTGSFELRDEFITDFRR